ncbi:MAG: DoxX family protein [Bacteroidales bacterium]
MKTTVLLSRYIGGIVFIFSGFVKAIDPVGSQIKFSDYFAAAEISMDERILLAAAMILCAVEFITGILLITGRFYRWGVYLYFLFMILFTPLTLFLAIYNPVSDCGCFGDAIHLTNWETFFKNIVFMAIGVVLVMTRKKYAPSAGAFATDTLMAGSTLILFFLFMAYNIRYLPVIDFRPYKTGINIAESMTIPENAPQDIYQITLIYEKDGVSKEFTLDNYPAGDTTWKFVDQRSVLISRGYEPPIMDFHISTLEGREITDYLLYDAGYSLLMISHDLDKAAEKDLEKGFLTGFNAVSNDISFYVVSSTTRQETEKYLNGLQFCIADGTLLKTIIRSNPGYLLLKEGTIIGKWSPASLPDDKWFETNMVARVIREGTKDSSVFITALFILLFTGNCLFYRGFDRYIDSQ